MKVTTRGRYALRAMLALARLGKDGMPVSIGTLSEEERISPIFLEQIFFKLRKAGLVGSVRGPGGGFFFEKPLAEITLKAILEGAGEEMNSSYCGKRGTPCVNQNSCLSHKVWDKVGGTVDHFFMKVTLASILDGGIDSIKMGEDDGETENQR